MVGWFVGSASRLAALDKRLTEHLDDCVSTRQDLMRRFDQHDAQVTKFHAQNTDEIKTLAATINQLKGSTAAFDNMLPAIRESIEDSAHRAYRRKLVGRVAMTVFTTVVTISGLIPLAQLLIGLHVTFHF